MKTSKLREKYCSGYYFNFFQTLSENKMKNNLFWNNSYMIYCKCQQILVTKYKNRATKNKHFVALTETSTVRDQNGKTHFNIKILK